MRIVSAIFALLIFLSASFTEAKQINIGISTGYPPFYFYDENDEPKGICIDIIKQVTRGMNVTPVYTRYPWKRMLFSAKEGHVDAIMPLFKTEERNLFLIFPATELILESNNFFTHIDSSIRFNRNFEELKRFNICVIDKFSYGKKFDQTGFPSKTVVQTVEQMIKPIAYGRMDLGIGNINVISFHAKKMGLEKKIKFLDPEVTSEPLYIGFSRKKINKSFVKEFNRHLDLFKSDSAYQSILQTYK